MERWYSSSITTRSRKVVNKLSWGFSDLLSAVLCSSLFPLLYHTLLFKTKSEQDQSQNMLLFQEIIAQHRFKAVQVRTRQLGSSTNPAFPTCVASPTCQWAARRRTVAPVSSCQPSEYSFPISPGHEPAHAWWKNRKPASLSSAKTLGSGRARDARLVISWEWAFVGKAPL